MTFWTSFKVLARRIWFSWTVFCIKTSFKQLLKVIRMLNSSIWRMQSLGARSRHYYWPWNVCRCSKHCLWDQIIIKSQKLWMRISKLMRQVQALRISKFLISQVVWSLKSRAMFSWRRSFSKYNFQSCAHSILITAR